MSLLVTKPSYHRRKLDRPDEISAAAFEAFAEKGYAATRVEEVAKRAGVSKGLMYLYFKTKEELFKAVIRQVVIRRIDALIGDVQSTELSPEEFIRGPIVNFLKKIPDSPVAVVIRLLIAEGPRHPDLVEFYYDNVVSKGLTAIKQVLSLGIERGDFQKHAVTEQPHLFVAPVMLSIIWNILFTNKPFDTDKLIETQIDLLLATIKA